MNPALSFFAAGAKALIVLATILTVLLVGWSTWSWYRPDLYFNPISRHVHAAYMACRDAGQCPSDAAGWRSMIPDVFSVGDTRAQVAKRLSEAGLDEWVIDEHEGNYRQLGSAISPLFCTKYYNIRVTFDSSQLLLTADSTFSGTPSCL